MIQAVGVSSIAVEAVLSEELLPKHHVPLSPNYPGRIPLL